MAGEIPVNEHCLLGTEDAAPGINVEPVVAYAPSGDVAYCVWVHDPVHEDLVTSNLGRSLVYSICRRATDSWSVPKAIVPSPDDYPGMLEPYIALKSDDDGLLALTALEKGTPERGSAPPAEPRPPP
jgi:hypothetical protein